MGVRKEVLENQAEATFFEEVNNLPFGEPFGEFLKENTKSITRKLNLKEKEISGEISGSSIPFRMVLSIDKYEVGEYKEYKKPVVLDICGHCAMPLMSFYAIESNIVGRDYDVKFSVNYGKYSLLPEDDDRILLDMIPKFSQKISQYQIEKTKGTGDGDGAGPH